MYSYKTETELAEAIAKFYDDPLGWVLFSYPWGEPKLADGSTNPLRNEPGPNPWQRQLLEEIGAHIKVNNWWLLQSPKFQRYIWRSARSSGHGVGKHLANNTVIPTPCGPRKYGDLVLGDVVFGGDGKPTWIIGIKRFKNIPMYRVTFDDGSSARVSSGHLWNVRGRQERRKGLASWRALETIDILERGVKRPNGVALARQWEIPVQGSAEFEEREIDIHPYLMGVWLGDGAKGQPQYCKPYTEIANKIRSLGYEVSDYADGKNHRILNCAHLFSGGVFECGSHERYIPDDYKYNTVENRRALFCGLMDSDGEVSGAGQASCGYSTTSKRLADDVLWLSRSLGFKAMLQPTTKEAWYYGDDGERVECRDCYRLTIQCPFNPFTLEHRKDVYKPCTEARYMTRWIDSIEPEGVDEDGMCISVMGDGLYLANDFIVTHNSAVVSWLIQFFMSTRRDCRVQVTANTAHQLETKTWPELAKWHKLLINKHWFTWTSTSYYFKPYPEEQRKTYMANAITVSEENTEAFAGLHNAASTNVNIFDEASGIFDKLFEVAEGALTDGEGFFLIFGNPTKPTGRFAEIFDEDNEVHKMWNTETIDSRSVPQTNKQQLYDIIRMYGADSDEARVRVYGRFPRQAFNGFISKDVIDAAISRELWYDSGAPIIMGVDVARHGRAASVIRIRRGRDARSIPPITLHGKDNVQVAEICMREADKHRPDAIAIEGTGPGGGVIDIMKDRKYRVIEIHPGALASDRMHYDRQRDEMWGKCRDWLIEEGCIPEEPRLIEQLSKMQYSLDRHEQRYVIEKKDEYMERTGLQSPDEADSLILTFGVRIARRDRNLDLRINGGGRSEAITEYDVLAF